MLASDGDSDDDGDGNQPGPPAPALAPAPAPVPAAFMTGRVTPPPGTLVPAASTATAATAAAAAVAASPPTTPEAGVAALAAPTPSDAATPTNSESDSQQDDLEAEKGCLGCCPWLSILPFAAVQRPLLRHRTRRDHATPPNRHSRSRSRARSLFARCRHRFGGRDILEELESVPVCNV